MGRFEGGSSPSISDVTSRVPLFIVRSRAAIRPVAVRVLRSIPDRPVKEGGILVARLSAGSRYTEFPLVLLGLGAAACTALVAYGTANGKMPPAFVEATGVVVALFLLRGWLVARGRRWISPTEQGFILEDRHGTRSITDDDISDLATESTVYYGNGAPKAIVRRGAIILRDGRVPFRYDFPLNQPDPLGLFLDRVLARLTDRAAAAIAAGDALQGDRWELTEDGLVVRSGGGERGLAAEDVVAADVVDGHVCVWGRREEHPFARIPVGSANAPDPAHASRRGHQGQRHRPGRFGRRARSDPVRAGAVGEPARAPLRHAAVRGGGGWAGLVGRRRPGALRSGWSGPARSGRRCSWPCS